ncbi:MAG: hypothetical protein ABTS16_17990 [Candidatus Accumulibacter phosphatis]|jgi:hypothetical protein|uniref:Uncharacterized protein n=1 Tax=Candidatus Accumulibacter phosphatis TaxID=327160 RepID=A0A080LUQ8_9PROT|nr:hypothetical protein [Accumulibacter sp.]KFB72273.1 MAG: hypothetical protein AW09_002527 [Candidatus Accumulibacter phosphatis]MBL8408719.1 hypothetical protein [Accumulibacter sp.]HRF11482.1 hypothetical protein [Candidatus Accumulibacter phosphatis]
MISQEIRRPGYYATSHRFEWAVLLVVIGLLAIGLLSALHDANERAERQAVELTIRNMRTGMQLAVGEALMQQREGEMAAWVGINPVRWLGSDPAGYRGECSAAESRDLPAGAWCFDRDRRQLMYRPRHTGHLRVPAVDDGGRCDVLSWRVTRVSERMASGAGLRLAAAADCRWVLGGS